MSPWRSPQWPLAACLALLLSTTGCIQFERQGGPCSTDGDCAVGLTCKVKRCRSASDQPAPGLEPIMHGLRRSASKEAPHERDDIPSELLEAVRTIGDEIQIDIYTNRHIPPRVVLQDGTQYDAAGTAERLTKRVTGLAMETQKFRLGKRMGLSEERAVQERLHILRSDTGVPVFIGAVLRVGVRQEVIPSIIGPEHVDHALAVGLWRLHAKKQGRLRVGFICTAGAFCPRIEQKPTPAGRGDWSEEMGIALNDVYEPFDEIRQELVTELQENGVHPLAVIVGQPIPEHVDVVVLAGATQPLGSDALAWMTGLREKGVGLVLLVPGARMVASTGRLGAIESGQAELLGAFGVRRTDVLLADRASLAKFKAPDRSAIVGDLLPLVAEVARTASFHETVSGLYGLSLPFASALQGTRDGVKALAWSRPGVSPVTLPTAATNAALESAAPPQPQGDERVLAVAIDDANLGRVVIIGSSLACVGMAASELIKNVDQAKLEGQPVEYVRRLLPFGAAARAYRSTHRGNRTLRASTLRFFEQTAYWAAEPEKLRSLMP